MTFRELKIARRLHSPLPPHYEFWLRKLLETRQYSRFTFRRLMYVGTFMPFVFEVSSDFYKTFNKIILGNVLRIQEEHLLLLRGCDRKFTYNVREYNEDIYFLDLGKIFYQKQI